MTRQEYFYEIGKKYWDLDQYNVYEQEVKHNMKQYNVLRDCVKGEKKSGMRGGAGNAIWYGERLNYERGIVLGAKANN